MNNEGFALVECLSMCPTQWKVPPVEALKWIEEKMIPYYPLGEFGTIKKLDFTAESAEIAESDQLYELKQRKQDPIAKDKI